MTEYDNNNRGVLFKNDRKTEGDKKPEYTGSLNVDGVEFFLDAWLKVGKSGVKFMSVSVKRKDKQTTAAQQRTPSMPGKALVASSGFDDMDDDIPFVSSAFAWDLTTSKQRRMLRYDY